MISSKLPEKKNHLKIRMYVYLNLLMLFNSICKKPNFVESKVVGIKLNYKICRKLSMNYSKLTTSGIILQF